MKVIKTIKDLNIFIEEFDNYSFDPENGTVFFSYSYSHYADQEHKVEGEALAFLLGEEAAKEYAEQIVEEEGYIFDEDEGLF